MRVLVDLRSHDITQVEQVPEAAVGVAINGKYVLPLVPGADFPINSNSYVLDGGGDVDGGDVSSISFAHLLASYPQFGNIYFNPLLTAANVGELSMGFAFTDPVSSVEVPVRCQTGRFGGASPGQMPTHTALLEQNDATTPSRPGLIVTEEIDLTAYTAGVGADEFMIYWKLLDFAVSSDVRSDYGATVRENSPATRQVFETDQEPGGFSVYITTDNGEHWCEAGLLEPIAFCAKSTSLRVAFRNANDFKIFLAHFAVLF